MLSNLEDDPESPHSPSAAPPPDRSDCHQDPPVSMSCPKKDEKNKQPLIHLHEQEFIRLQTSKILQNRMIQLFQHTTCEHCFCQGVDRLCLPYDVGCSFSFLGQKFRIMHHLLQETNHFHFELSVGFKVLQTYTHNTQVMQKQMLILRTERMQKQMFI